MSSQSQLDEIEEAIIGDFIPLQMIQSCERDYKKKIETGTLTEDLKFQYSWYLIKSRYKNDVKKGIQLMAELCQDGVDQRDHYYFLGVGYYKLEEYQEAELCVNRVLNMEPKNIQAQQLKQLITEKQRRDSLITAGVVGGTAIAGAAVVGGIVLLAAGIAKLASK